MRRILILGLAVAAGAPLSACGDETPTSVGGDIIEEGFRTFEVVLEAPEFLEADTTYDRLGSLIGLPFGLVARSFGDELFARTLFRITFPEQVTYEDADENSVTDSVFTVVGGTATVVFDSLGDSTGPIQIEVVDVTESWHAGSVSWEQRFDTAGVSAPWQEPGGTTGQVLATATWEAGDTLRIPLDSAAASVWTDSASAFHGGLVRSATDGTRLRIQALTFEFDVRPESADTIVPAGSMSQRAVVVTPEASAPDGTELRIGGAPTWRSVLLFRLLEDVQIPCGPDTTGCTIPIRDVDVNLAALLLQPLTVTSRRIERPMRIEGRAVLRAPGVPVSRSPLSNAFGRMESALEPADFETTTGGNQRAVVPITDYVRRNLNPVGDEAPIVWIALVAEAEPAIPVFGYASFGSLQSSDPPRLRLVVTVPEREESQ